MAEILDLIMTSPATWGGAGAFIYAAPRWLACAVPKPGAAWSCTMEALVSIAVGVISAAAFSHWLLAFLHQRPADLPAVAAMVGLLANPVAPKLVEGLSTIVANRAAKLLKEDEK